ncbi:hypothetical protein ACFL6Y_02940 [Elusimicrobiota bacterium]
MFDFNKPLRQKDFIALICLGILVYGIIAVAERLTITSYYPSPYGVYKELRSTQSSYLAANSGNVGIGTTNPQAKLDVAGNARLAPTSEPGTPVAGMLYYDQTTNKLRYYQGGASPTWQNIGGAAAIPSGFCVFSGNSSQTTCPAGWAESTQFDGRTLRGIKNRRIIDPDCRGNPMDCAWTLVREIPGETGGNNTHDHEFSSPTCPAASGSDCGVTVDTKNASSWPPYKKVIVCCKT